MVYTSFSNTLDNLRLTRSTCSITIQKFLRDPYPTGYELRNEVYGA